MKQLSEVIKELINLKQEGEYWDYKRQWYSKDNKDDMLHDIICMSNNLVNGDAYIIIGVDEENDYQLVDVSDDKERKNTQNIVDFLRSKKFAGDIRPRVTVETVIIEGKQLDVLVIHNSNDTPFYLKEKYKKVRKYNIYTRVQDTNTPVNSSADNSHVELLWKKRFGLSLTPLERCNLYLGDKDGWEQSEFYNERYHYKLFPEFTIDTDFESEETRDGNEYYMFNQTNMNASWASVSIRYYHTTIFQVLAVCLDGARYLAITPDRSLLKIGKHKVYYGYMNEDSIRYALKNFFYDENREDTRWAHRIYIENILIFKNDNERTLFEEFVRENWNDSYEKKINNINQPYIPEDGLNYKLMEDTYKIVQIMQEMLIQFRRNNTIFNRKNEKEEK